MTRETITFTVEYNKFEIGEKVKAGSNRCSLEKDKIYVVAAFHPPMFPGEDSIIFVEGQDTGLTTEYVIPA